MPSNKYLSKWSGEDIDRAYEVIQHLSTGQVDKLTYVDSSGNLRVTSFKKEKVGLIDTTTWESESIPANSFLIKNNDGEIAPSDYNYFSFIGYRESGATTGPNGCLASLHAESSGGTNKYSVLNTGITTLQLTTAFGDIENLKEATTSGTNDGINWTTITIGTSTYNIPNNGSVAISQIQVDDPAKVPSSALMYSVNSRVVELETQLAAALQEINSLKQRVSAIEGDYVVATGENTEVEVSGNSIKFISDVTTSGNEISFTQSSTHLDGNDILL